MLKVCAAYAHGHKRLDDDATGWWRHQRSTGQTAHTPFWWKCRRKIIHSWLLSV